MRTAKKAEWRGSDDVVLGRKPEIMPDTSHDEVEADETGPVRRCIISGNRLPKEAMIRFVVAPGGAVVPDIAGKLPGRGFWLTADRMVLNQAIKKRAFDRAARRSVKPLEDLEERVENLLAIRCKEALGLARRAGSAVAGFEKVREALRARQAGLLLAASDGAAGGKEKIAGLAPTLSVISVLSAAELGAAFGRDHAVHVLVSPGGLARRLEIDAARLAGFRVGAKPP